MFSHNRDWLSCTPADTPWPSGVPARSDRDALLVKRVAGLVQEENSASPKSFSRTRVVMRTSPSENLVQKGWCVLSSRPRAQIVADGLDRTHREFELRRLR